MSDTSGRRGGVFLRWGGLMLIVSLAAPHAAGAATYRWQFDASGDWNNPANWTVVQGPAGVGYPNLPRDVAIIDRQLTAVRTITIPNSVTITIGRLTLASAEPGRVKIARAGTGLLVFDNAGAVAEISASGAFHALLTPIELHANLLVTRTVAAEEYSFQGELEIDSIGEAGGARTVTKAGRGIVRYGAGPNSYSGTTTVLEGELTMLNANTIRIAGDLTVGDGVGLASSAKAQVSSQSLGLTSNVTVLADGGAVFAGPLSIGELSITGGTAEVKNGEVSLGTLIMQGGELLANGISTIALTGNVSATSTAAGPARIQQGGFAAGVDFRVAGTGIFTIEDGPQAIDLSVYLPMTGGQLIKEGAGVMGLFAGGINEGARLNEGTLVMEGSLRDIDPQGGTIAGSGEIGAVGANQHIGMFTSGIVAPGNSSPGVLSVGFMSFSAGMRLDIDIMGTAPGAFDQLKVGTAIIQNPVLTVASVPVLPPNATFEIVSNSGPYPVAGTFKDLSEGATFTTASGVLFKISYVGGDGNDVVLTNVTPVDYYLSEGATGAFFDEDVLIANPHAVDAPITMTFFRSAGGTIVQQRIVPALSRLTVHVDEIPGLEHASASVQVRSEGRLPLAVERTMFWDATRYGGHTANAVPRAERQWFFAEGAQGFFQTYLLLANPNTVSVDAEVTFLRENGAPVTDTVALPAQSRVTVYAGDYAELAGQSFGMTVATPLPITAERATYFATTPERLWSGGHANAGSAAPSTSWFHPEGASGTFFSTFILMSNPQATPAQVTMRFLLASGSPVEIIKTIPARQRLTVNPAGEGILDLQNASFSTVISSDVPIVSERAMYWPGDNTPFGEGHVSSGVVATSLGWDLAEGRVGGSFAYTTYILLANPQDEAAQVEVTFLRENGAALVKAYTVPPNSRFNIEVGQMVPELANESFGARVRVTNQVPIAVERSMYWNANGMFWSGGSNALAEPVPQ